MAEIYPLHHNGRVEAGLTFGHLHIRAHTSVRIYGRRTIHGRDVQNFRKSEFESSKQEILP